MPSACDRVFSTPELLEAVLAELEPLHLLLAQRLSRQFHSAITSSPRLQQRLFFRPESVRDSKEWEFNPLLREPFLPWFVLPGSRWSLPDYSTIELLDWTKDVGRREALLRADASWRRMLLVQPPPKSLLCRQFCHAQMGDSVVNATIHFDEGPRPGGVTMGIIYDITESFLRGRQASQFGLSISDTESGPQITLYMLFTIQCCPSHFAHEHRLKSQGAEMGIKDLQAQFKANPPVPNKRQRLSMTWSSNLSAEKGGVDHFEFQEWKRVRSPISSLISDIR